MMDYITPTIIQQHCDFRHQTGDPTLDIHSNFDFLPFHKAYIEGLEDYLYLQGFGQYVPLAQWDSYTDVPFEIRFGGDNNNGIDTDYALNGFVCHDGGDIEGCAQIEKWDVSSTFQDVYLNNLCSHDQNGAFGGIGYHLSHGYHNLIHGEMGGLMSQFRAPAAPIFWFWHAWVDQQWQNWECDCTTNPTNTTHPVDLYMKDNNYVMESIRDTGNEPNIDPNSMWESKDIWVRHSDIYLLIRLQMM